MDLNQTEKLFLEDQNIPLTMIFNAAGYKKSEYRNLMKSQGKIIAYNTTPCKAYGHRLRTRSGHCIQCDTAKIAFIKRHVERGKVYLAGSINGSLIKVGFSKDELREASLNLTKYGGQDDWKILFTIECEHAGSLEGLVQKELSKYGISIQYDHDGHLQRSTELFKCSYSKAKECLENMLDKEQVNTFNKTEKTRIIEDYKFRNLIQPT